MKKIFKKLKLKHFARLMLVVISLCFITTVSAFAYNTYSIEIGFYNTNEYPYEPTSIRIFSDGLNYDSETYLDIDEYTTIDFNYLYSTQSDIAVVDGDFGYYDDDGEFIVYQTDIGAEDGYYNMFTIVCYNSSSDSSYYCPQIQGYEPTYSDLSDGVNYYFLEKIPSTILVEVVDITESYDTDNGYLASNNYILLPAPPPPPPPQESITNVWSGVLTFLTTSISTFTNVFWDGSSLTLLGMLGLIGVSISIIILVFLRVKDFLKLR